MKYKVKITNWIKKETIEVQYPPNPTCYYYCTFNSPETTLKLTQKLIDIMRDNKNADIEIIDKE